MTLLRRLIASWRSPTRERLDTSHATLREQAAGRLGPDALAGFAGRLHAWADSYRASGWPDDTTEYLLLGYPRMLADAGDAGRLAALAADPARHRRLLAAIGGEAAALAEIAAALALISSSPSPDLLAALRLAWHRDRLTDRNTQVPHQLPVVWVTLGQPLRAEALAWSITRLEDRAPALADVARAMAVTGDYARAQALVGETERIARSITRPFDQGRALAGVARAAAVGDHDRARALAGDALRTAQSVTDPRGQMRALPDVARALAAAGDYDRAEPVARATAHLDDGRALAGVARAGRCGRWPTWPRRRPPPATTTGPGSWPATPSRPPGPSPARTVWRWSWPKAPRWSTGLPPTRTARRQPWPTPPGRWRPLATMTGPGSWPTTPSRPPGLPPTRAVRRGS